MVDIPTPGTHDKAVRGGKAKAVRNAFSLIDSCYTAAVAQMNGNHLGLRMLEMVHGPFRHIFMAGAVKAIGLDAMMGIKSIRYRIFPGFHRHGLMKRSVEDRYLLGRWKNLFRHENAFQDYGDYARVPRVKIPGSGPLPPDRPKWSWNNGSRHGPPYALPHRFPVHREMTPNSLSCK